MRKQTRREREERWIHSRRGSPQSYKESQLHSPPSCPASVAPRRPLRLPVILFPVRADATGQPPLRSLFHTGTGRPRSQRESICARASSASACSTLCCGAPSPSCELTVRPSSLSNEVATAAASPVPSDMSARIETHTRSTEWRAFVSAATTALLDAGINKEAPLAPLTTECIARRSEPVLGVEAANDGNVSGTGGRSQATSQADCASAGASVTPSPAASSPSHSACWRPASRCGWTSVCKSSTRVSCT
mmetsp:Transcript_28913/g.78937  ORF Transcript_28913/g.78937 Transcript_28913/m.78937 type:complete len:249 (-) Transcript_28913:3176-3922(-)